ncbi:MAG: phage tail sheath family protein, partial [Pseudomonadota bacterium]
FLHGIWREGALAGAKPDEAFYARCDRTTMSQSDIDRGQLILEIGVAPLKPAEYIVLRVEHNNVGLPP